MKQTLIVFLMTVVIGYQIAKPQQSPTREPSQAHDFSELNIRWDQPSPDPSMDKLIEVFKGSNSIAEAIQKIANLYPNYISRYTMMYDSDSQQEATPLRPRVIVYGQQARTVIAFNGDEKLAGYGSIESYEFTPKGYKFRDFSFKSETPKNARFDEADTDSAQSNEKLIVSKPNPVRCMECHDFVKPHPIFDNYFTWPGAFGSEDDLVTSADSSRSVGRAFKLKNKKDDPELEYFNAFKTEFKNNPQDLPRYAPLFKYPLNDKRANRALTALLASQAYYLLAKDASGARKMTGDLYSCEDSKNEEYKIWKNQFRVLKRMQKLFQGKLSDSPLQYTTEKTQELISKFPEESQFIIELAVYSLDAEYKASACLEKILNTSGLSLSNYAFNRDRAPIIFSGGANELDGLLCYIRSRNPDKCWRK